MRAIFEIMISPYHVLCYIPRILDIFDELENIPRNLEIQKNVSRIFQHLKKKNIFCIFQGKYELYFTK